MVPSFTVFAQWFRTAKNRGVSIETLTCPLIHFLAMLTHLLAGSRALGKVIDLMSQNHLVLSQWALPRLSISHIILGFGSSGIGRDHSVPQQASSWCGWTERPPRAGWPNPSLHGLSDGAGAAAAHHQRSSPRESTCCHHKNGGFIKKWIVWETCRHTAISIENAVLVNHGSGSMDLETMENLFANGFVH